LLDWAIRLVVLVVLILSFNPSLILIRLPDPPFPLTARNQRCPLLVTILLLSFGFTACASPSKEFDLDALESPRILNKAARYLKADPITVTANVCERSEGGPHDFYSEGDYWWPNPEDPTGPYVRRDGETNPENFIEHRESLIRFSDIMGTLVSAYALTADEKYAAHAVAHLKAWFVNPETRMNPSLLYGQAISGRHTGRSIGIIDTIHLVEVALGANRLEGSPSFSNEDRGAVKAWFRDYLDWISTHPYGLKEKQHPNNHGVCWSLQAAAFAQLVGDTEILAWIRKQFKEVYLAEMMDLEGGFPAELKRTKPYGYSLFVMDAMAGVAQIASVAGDNLWQFEMEDGRGMRLGMQFIAPYIADKDSWKLPQDVMYWEDWPVRSGHAAGSAAQRNCSDERNRSELYSPRALPAKPRSTGTMR
jgi:hypothetical protein